MSHSPENLSQNHAKSLPRAGTYSIFRGSGIGSKNRGFILHEAMMALGLSMALSVGVAQLLVVVAQQRRLARQYATAEQEAGNLMEILVSRSWKDTTSQALASLDLSKNCVSRLPQASISLDVADEDTRTRRITVHIEWQSAPQRAPESVRLVGWRFLGEGEES